ncbi:MAG: type IV secretory system conjugative DNA transfer family protein [Deltaproteobacteria bacterium]|nr:type IV secretory system conjugative DNA transfer family protein [Deltaproteobacteria bacterium]MCL5891889.1 type IV secretory system conjugative DNA transfer family protein [Deltaproteobacteria bacterium]
MFAKAEILETGKEIEIGLPDRHTIVFGETGAGKTESVLLNFWKGKKIITIIDGKGELAAKDTAKKLRPEAMIYDFQSKINLLKGLSEKEISELIINSLYPKEISTAESFYQNFATQALRFVLKYIENPTFEKIFIALYKDNILKLYKEQAGKMTEAEKLIAGGLVEDKNYGGYISGFLDKLQPFALSKNFNTEEGENIDFSKVNWVSLRNIQEENSMGRMIIENLRLRKPKELNYEVCLCIDEFADLMFSAFSKIIKEIRSFKVQLVMMTQSLSDADRFDSALLDILLSNSQNKYFMKQDSIRNEDISKLFGNKIFEYNTKSKDNAGTLGIAKSERRDYIIQPQAFGKLKPGQAYAKTMLDGTLEIVGIEFNRVEIER